MYKDAPFGRQEEQKRTPLHQVLCKVGMHTVYFRRHGIILWRGIPKTQIWADKTR